MDLMSIDEIDYGLGADMLAKPGLVSRQEDDMDVLSSSPFFVRLGGVGIVWMTPESVDAIFNDLDRVEAEAAEAGRDAPEVQVDSVQDLVNLAHLRLLDRLGIGDIEQLG